jgi:hypothetical protein
MENSLFVSYYTNLFNNYQSQTWEDYKGPDSEDVRDDIEEDFWKQWKEGKPEYNSILIQECIDRIIPLSRNDFGTWRMYQDTGKKQIKNIVKRLYYKEIEKSKNIIISKFVPYIIHKLYNPDNGLMVKKKEREFNIKKSELNKKK